MIKRVNNPEELSNVMRDGYQGDVLYDLGEGEKRTELIVTHVDENLGEDRVIKSDRIASPLQIRMQRSEDGRMSMDFTHQKGKPLYENLRPKWAIYTAPNYPEYELGDLQINLNENGSKYLGITQFYRAE